MCTYMYLKALLIEKSYTFCSQLYFIGNLIILSRVQGLIPKNIIFFQQAIHFDQILWRI